MGQHRVLGCRRRAPEPGTPVKYKKTEPEKLYYREVTIFVTTQVLKTTAGGLHYAGTTRDMGHTVTKQRL